MFSGRNSFLYGIGTHLYEVPDPIYYTRDEASNTCTQTGGNLLEIDDATEQKNIEQLIKELIQKNGNEGEFI